MKFEWDNDIKLGVAVMDNEHIKLIEQANRLFDSLTQAVTSDGVLETLKFLEKYTLEHFSNEESLLNEIDYPNRLEHTAIHDSFRRRVEELIKDVEVSGISPRKKLEINRMMVNWITHHIGVEDRKIAEYILKEEQL